MTHLKIHHHPLFNENFNNNRQNFFTPFSSLFRDEILEKKIAHPVPVNIKETDKHFFIEIVAPGFTKQDFKINLDKNILTIGADKVKSENDEKWITNQYTYPAFSRSFTLPKHIYQDAISAEYVNGILKLNLPKKAEVKTPVKQISIN